MENGVSRNLLGAYLGASFRHENQAPAHQYARGGYDFGHGFQLPARYAHA